MRYAILITLITAFTATAIFAQKVDETCSIKGWIEDKELHKDIFVHETPSPLGKTIGELPFGMEEEDQMIVEIIGYTKGEYTNGWLKILKAVTVEDKVIFEGIGWIPALRVSANVQRPDGNSKKSATLYSQPKSSSKKVGTIPSETLIDIIGFDCFGLKVIYKGKKGWLSRKDICGNPVTTCS